MVIEIRCASCGCPCIGTAEKMALFCVNCGCALEDLPPVAPVAPIPAAPAPSSAPAWGADAFDAAAERYLRNGDTLLMLEEYADALEAYRAASKAAPADYRCWLSVARCIYISDIRPALQPFSLTYGGFLARGIAKDADFATVKTALHALNILIGKHNAPDFAAALRHAAAVAGDFAGRAAVEAFREEINLNLLAATGDTAKSLTVMRLMGSLQAPPRALTVTLSRLAKKR